MEVFDDCRCDNITGMQIFLSSRCNLACSYCYISKEKSLCEYDNIIREALEDGTYAKSIIDFNNIVDGGIKSIELWGGEPTLNLDAFGKNIPLLLGNLTKLEKMIMSTNMTGNIDNLIDFLIMIDNRESRNPFTFHLQISMDGPSYINDITRGGKDSSDRIIENTKKLISAIELKNTTLHIAFKATLPINVFETLCPFENILSYYRFWDDLVNELNKAVGSKVSISIHGGVIPTIVYPGMYTQSDGIILSQYTRALHKLSKWAKMNNELRTYKSFNPYRVGWNSNNTLTLPDKLPFCGVYTSNVGLLHTGDIVPCHRGFFDLIDGYLNSDRNEMSKRGVAADSYDMRASIRDRALNIYSDNFKEKLDKVRKQYITSGARIASIAMLIKAMANIGQVSSIYKDDDKALEAALIVRNQNDCTYDNQLTTGTISSIEIGVIRVLCNGVIEYILDNKIGGNNNVNSI